MIRFLVLPLFLALVAFPFGAYASAYKPSSAGVALEVVMDGQGNVRVAGARVLQVTDTGFTAETLWGSGKLTWTVRTDEATPITRKSGGKIPLTQVTAGDYVSFTGLIQTNMPPFTVDAKSVRDWSIGERHTVHAGTVSAIDTEARTITITTDKGGVVTVKTDEDTAFAQSGARSLLDLSIGDTVLAFGDATGATISASKVNLTKRALAGEGAPRKVATGFGPWIDKFLPQFFEGRIY